MTKIDYLVIGGGAAGFFGAIHLAENQPGAKVLILEKGKALLQKVKISGGGRCNVTHACFIPRELIGFYPRGSRELMGPFNTFQPGDTFEWFAERGVNLVTEEDGRVFPESNTSETIIECFQSQARKLGVEIHTHEGLTSITQDGENWQIQSSKATYLAKKVLIATGSSKAIWDQLGELGLDIVEPRPSLFTFRCQDSLIEGLAGISFPNIEIATSTFPNKSYVGPLLITHRGFSGPGILKCSAWQARELYDTSYQFDLKVNFIGMNTKECLKELRADREANPKKKLRNSNIFELPKRFWERLTKELEIDDLFWASVSKVKMIKLAESLCARRFFINGKNTFKDEFVTCGGISLKEIDFKRMEAKKFPGLHFAGEVMNIDAVTGGFNFQAAWTTSFIAATAMARGE